jgi:hypothetical protein
MEPQTTYDHYPARIVLPIILFSIVMYIFGAIILARLHITAAALYLAYCVAIEVNIMNRSCRPCYYYGKRCAFGKGALSARLFSQQDLKIFSQREASIATIIPDFLVVILPVVGGLVSLIFAFSWFVLAAVLVFLFIFLAGTATIRGSVACKFCKQRELGCPAAELFEH